MTVSAYQVYRRPPPLYRVARTLRRISLLVLILLIVFTASAAYSAVLTAQSASHLGAISETFASNGTLVLSGTLTLNNNGIYEVQGLALSVRISNASGVLVGAVRVGPTDLPRQSSTAYPLTVYVPVSGSGPGPSLLTEDQSLPVTVWGNATLGYLFPVGLLFSTTRSWGAPFSNLNVSIGTPSVNATGTSVPITLTFQNHAPLTDAGSLQFALLSPGGERCGAGGFAIEVPSGAPFSQTTQVLLANGCSLAGGSLQSSFVAPDYTVSLPSEPIP